MRRHDEDLTPSMLDELAAIEAALAGEPVGAEHADTAVLTSLLVAERPRPSERFAAELDTRVASGFAQPAAAHTPGRWAAFLARPFLPAAAATLAVALVALVVALNVDGPASSTTSSAGSPSSAVSDGAATGASGAAEPATDAAQPSADTAETPEAARRTSRDATDELFDEAAKAGSVAQGLGSAPSALGYSGTRKVVRSANIELGTAKDRIDDVAQDVLAATARFGGIVDQSSVASGRQGGSAHFALRIPSARLQPALAAFSQLPGTHVLARNDDQVDVNQAYVSIRRRLANARAERAGVVRALAAADTEDETLRLRDRLDVLERTIAQTERAQRGLDRRIDFSGVTLSVRADGRSGDGDDASGPFSIGRAFHDAGRVLEVAAGVAVIAAAALLPLALLLACIWPLARALRRRQREQALDTA